MKSVPGRFRQRRMLMSLAAGEDEVISSQAPGP